MIKIARKLSLVITIVFTLVVGLSISTSALGIAKKSDTAKKLSVNTKAASNTQHNVLGYLKITIKGNSKTYSTSDGVDLSAASGSDISFKADNSFDKDSFVLRIPTDGKVGDILIAQGSGNSTPNNSLWLEYTNLNGVPYAFGYPSGSGRDVMHKSSKAVVKFTQWDIKGGYIMGTVGGEITLNSSQTITFTNGEFKIKIGASMDNINNNNVNVSAGSSNPPNSGSSDSSKTNNANINPLIQQYENEIQQQLLQKQLEIQQEQERIQEEHDEWWVQSFNY